MPPWIVASPIPRFVRPGEAFLEFRIEERADGSTDLRMIPSFLPRGFWGRLYWSLIAPSHVLLFRSMLQQMARAAKVRIISGPSRIAKG